jgi:hypothetical protein
MRVRLLVLFGACLSVAAAAAGVPPASAGGGAAIRLDFNIENDGGPCRSIDASADIGVGQTLRVGVCLENPGTVPIAAFQFRIDYNDTIVRAPERPDVGDGLDDNPDMNAGQTTFSTPHLGGGWDCHAGVQAYPKGDADGIPGNGTGEVFSGGCGSVAGPVTMIRGPLGVIEFVGVAAGSTRLTFRDTGVVDDTLAEVGTCAPAIEIAMECVGGEIRVTGETPTETPEGQPTPTIVVEITQCVGPEGSCTPVVVTAVATQAPATGGAAAGVVDGGGDDGDGGDGDDATAAPAERTRTARATQTARTGVIGADDDDGDDDGGSAVVWIIVGVVGAVAIAGAGAGYYGYRRYGWFRR